MHIAIVNNSTKAPSNILSLFEDGDTHEIFDYSRASEIDDARFDLLVLSGSSLFPIEFNRDKLGAEIQLIQKSNLPIIGICYGCELIMVAFGGTLKDRGDHTQERAPVKIEVIKEDQIFLGRKDFFAYDAHRWIVDHVPTVIEILAQSAHGPEVIRHIERPIYGFQFHPEKMQDETLGNEIFEAFIKQHAKR